MKIIALLVMALSLSAHGGKPQPEFMEVRFLYEQANGLSGEYLMQRDYVDGYCYASWVVTDYPVGNTVDWEDVSWAKYLDEIPTDYYYAVIVTNPEDFENPENWRYYTSIWFHSSFYLDDGNELWVEPIRIVYDNGKTKKLKLRKD